MKDINLLCDNASSILYDRGVPVDQDELRRIARDAMARDSVSAREIADLYSECHAHRCGYSDRQLAKRYAYFR